MAGLYSAKCKSKNLEFNTDSASSSEEVKTNKEIVKESANSDSTGSSSSYKIYWEMVFLFTCFHIGSLYGVYMAFTYAKWQTILFTMCLNILATLGVTGGAHRLWSHRSYKAKLPLRIFFALIYTLSYQKSVYGWVENHRIHHKFSDSDSDPHDSRRGIFFSHIGWLLCTERPEVTEKRKILDLSDLEADPVVMFHKKYYLALALIIAFVLPVSIPILFWNENFIVSFTVSCLLRVCISSHQAWTINSLAHTFGMRPYDVTIKPRDNLFAILFTAGEGFHNYHHTFPYDYSTSEFGVKYNLTTVFIDIMAWLGLAYDRKSVSKSIVQARKLRTGERTGHVK